MTSANNLSNTLNEKKLTLKLSTKTDSDFASIKKRRQSDLRQTRIICLMGKRTSEICFNPFS